MLVQRVYLFGSDRALVGEQSDREFGRTEQSGDLVDQAQVAGHRIVRLERHIAALWLRGDMNRKVVLSLNDSILVGENRVVSLDLTFETRIKTRIKLNGFLP